MSKIITTYFSKNGVPLTGITPTIKIWDITTTIDTIVVNNDNMVEIGDGLYKYVLTTYNSRKNYGFIVNAGNSLPPSQRYQVSVNDSYVEDISFEVWEESELDHLTTGTMGAQQVLNSETLNAVSFILKFERNRTKINPIAKTLTVYDDDGTTPIRIFDLLDDNGIATITEIFERVPQ